ncbi:MAG: Asp-tRNA(Asn)/Glu-tRNA(Gln) amidotransferase subunit GatC [Patescibacteria group bacterium]
MGGGWVEYNAPFANIISVKLSKEEVLKIAKLAKLKLIDAEVIKYQEQLSDVLSYVQKLNELDTADVLPTLQVTGLKNVFRDDKVDKSRSIGSKAGKYFETEAIF